VTKAKLAEVIAFPPRCGDIAAMLRLMADEIEAGEHGDVVHIVSVVSGNRVDVRAWGSCDGLTASAFGCGPIRPSLCERISKASSPTRNLMRSAAPKHHVPNQGYPT
jgi:hypothetical protein